MSSPSQTPVSSSQFESILDAALSEYKKKTDNDLVNHWLSKELQSCDSAEAVLDIIRHQAEAFDKFRGGDKKLMKWIASSVHVLYTISATLGDGIGLVRIRKTIGDNLRCIPTSCAGGSFCENSLYRNWCPTRCSFIPNHPYSFLSTLLTLIPYRQQRMSERATMCSSTSLSAFNSSSSALGFILGFRRPRIWWRYL